MLLVKKISNFMHGFKSGGTFEDYGKIWLCSKWSDKTTTKIAGLWGCSLAAASSLKIIFSCSYLPKYIKVIDKTIYGNVICKWWPCGILTKNLASFLLIKLKSLSTRTDQAGSPKGGGTVESFLIFIYLSFIGPE